MSDEKTTEDKLDEMFFVERVRSQCNYAIDRVIDKHLKKHQDDIRAQIIRYIMSTISTEVYTDNKEMTIKFIIEEKN